MADEESAVKTVAKGGAILLLGSFASKAIMYFYRVLIGQELGPEIYGLLSLGLAVFWLSLTVTTFGTGGGMTRKISQYVGEGRKEKIREIFWGAIATTLPWSIIWAAGLFLSADLIATVIFNKPEMGQIIKIFALAIPFQTIYSDFAQVSKGLKNMTYITLVDNILRSLFILSATAAAIVYGMGLTAVVAIQSIAAVLSALMILYLTQTRIYPVLSDFSFDRTETRKLVKYSLPLFLGSLMGSIMGWTDTLLLGILKTSTEVGVYNAAFPTAQLLTVVASGFGGILFPVVSEMYGEGKKQKSILLTSTAIKWVFASTFPMLLIMIAFARPMLRLLFGESFIGGALALSILGTAYFIQSMTTYSGSYLQSEDRTKLIFYNSVGAAVINIILNVLLIPVYGQTGAALATAASTTILAIIASFEAYKFFDVQPFQWNRFKAPLLSALISAVSVYATVKFFFPVTPTLVLIPAFAIFGLLYATLYVIFGGVSEDDMEVLRAIDHKLPFDAKIVKKFVLKFS